MADISLRFNNDGTARATLVDSETGEPVEDFDWAANVLRTDDGYTVQLETLDGTQGHTVTTVPADVENGARDAVVSAMLNKATEEGHSVSALRIPEDQVDSVS